MLEWVIKMKTITLTDEELSLIHEHLMCLYDLICLLSWNDTNEHKDSSICNVKKTYKHILDVMDKAREKPKVSEDNTSVPQYYFDSGVIKKNKLQKS